ncbi:MAG: hypothetical protein RLZZ70_764 [Candidatus Parcubacteria bacterium]|jgi:uncharacterized membrane protein YczE
MTKGTAIFFLGIGLIFVPYLGIPLWWKQVVSVSIGIILIGLGYSIRRNQYLATLTHDGSTRASETFVETTEPLFDVSR